MSERLVLVLGGTRSGKSRFGQTRVTQLAAGRRVTYLATARPGDPELDRRIAGHRRMRPREWATVEVGTNLAVVLGGVDATDAILLDGLTLWLSAVAGDGLAEIDAIVNGPVEDAFRAIDEHVGPVVVVSDEIGLGMVPLDADARAFRDLQGMTHQRLAARSQEVYLMVAGLPLTVRNEP